MKKYLQFLIKIYNFKIMKYIYRIKNNYNNYIQQTYQKNNLKINFISEIINF